jgi:hypothetical protein
MVPYDVQAHPFNRAPHATPSAASLPRVTARGSESEGSPAGGSSQDSIWSVELDTGSCGCLSAYPPPPRVPNTPPCVPNQTLRSGYPQPRSQFPTAFGGFFMGADWRGRLWLWCFGLRSQGEVLIHDDTLSDG